MSAAPAAARRRVRVRVEGTVQGVGFRPYVYRLARDRHDAQTQLFTIGDTLTAEPFLAGLSIPVAEIFAT